MALSRSGFLDCTFFCLRLANGQMLYLCGAFARRIVWVVSAYLRALLSTLPAGFP